MDHPTVTEPPADRDAPTLAERPEPDAAPAAAAADGGRALRRRLLARPADPGDALWPWWAPGLFLLFAIFLVPWIAFLLVTLPQREEAAHWEVAWGGFDVGLALLLVATATALWRRSPAAEVLAAMLGTMLLCDAWFDTLTSQGSAKLTVALLEAGLAEIPLAAVCLTIAFNMQRAVGDALPHLRVAGFRIRGRRLRAPAEDPPPDTDPPPAR